jgi:predicted O-methyltransferase YrrM
MHWTDIGFLETFLEVITLIDENSRRLKIAPIEREDGLIIASLSYYIAALGGSVFIDAGAGIGYSTAWMLYGISGLPIRKKIFLYAIEKDPHRYSNLEENIEKLKNLLPQDSHLIEVNALNIDALDFLRAEDHPIDMVFVDIAKKQYIEVLKILPMKLSKMGLGVFHNALKPGLDEETREFLERHKEELLYHIIPTRLGLLIVKRTV